MYAIIVTPRSVEALKRAIKQAYPGVKSSFRTEAMGAACGCKTYAALLTYAKGTGFGRVVEFSPQSFSARLAELSGSDLPQPVFDFDSPLFARLANHGVEPEHPNADSLASVLNGDPELAAACTALLLVFGTLPAYLSAVSVRDFGTHPAGPETLAYQKPSPMSTVAASGPDDAYTEIVSFKAESIGGARSVIKRIDAAWEADQPINRGGKWLHVRWNSSFTATVLRHTSGAEQEEFGDDPVCVEVKLHGMTISHLHHWLLDFGDSALMARTLRALPMAKNSMALRETTAAPANWTN